MKRRDFLRSAASLTTGLALAESDSPTKWRTFEVVTRVELPRSPEVTRLWIPAGLTVETPYQKTLSNKFQVEGGTAKILDHNGSGLGIVSAEFPSGGAPVLTLVTQVSTRNYSVDLSMPGNAPKLNPAELRHFTEPTKMLPTDGIVGQKAAEITLNARTDLQKARAIYEWIVDNTFRNPKTQGCGVGNIRFMLESGDLSGKCADLNSLFVGLARAAGLPARDVFGIRVAKSNLGYKSLGTSSEIVSKAQHCRAEVYLTGYGWVPVDPADVRKVVLEEPPGNRTLDDDLVKKARTKLFGSWEMNWMAYNFASDVSLPGRNGAALPFFMYPQAETAGKRSDSLSPDTFKYEITAKEV